MPEIELIGGWGWPSAARKAHYFEAGRSRSVCGRWWFAGTRETGTAPTPSDCAPCRRWVNKHRPICAICGYCCQINPDTQKCAGAFEGRCHRLRAP